MNAEVRVDDGPYAALTAAVNAEIAWRYHAQIILLQYPSQGDFAWYYQNGEQVFNQWTRNYISARVSPGNTASLAQLSPADGLTDAYRRLLDSIEYRLSTVDAARADPVLIGTRASANNSVQRINEALASPTIAGGGMLTIDPQTGIVSAAPAPGYVVNESLVDIQAGLSAGGAAITVTVPGPSGTRMTLTYAGCVMVPVGPVAWQESTGSGWFAAEVIREAFANGRSDVTGYAFTTPPPFLPGPVKEGGTFGRISSLLISKPPRLVVQGGPVDSITGGQRSPAAETDAAAAVVEPLTRAVFDSLTLLGLGTPGGVRYLPRVVGGPDVLRPNLASGTAGPAGPAAGRAGPATGRTGLDAKPRAAIQLSPVPGPSVPQLQQKAYVVGVVVETP